MKKLLLLPFLFTMLAASSANANENITCALSTKSVGERVTKAKAQEVVQLVLIGENVYRMRGYSAHYYDRGYQPKSIGNGSIVELLLSEDGNYKFAPRTQLSGDLSELVQDRTTGGYPGAGPAPTRLHNYVCMSDYSKAISDVTRREVAQDFGLLQ